MQPQLQLRKTRQLHRQKQQPPSKWSMMELRINKMINFGRATPGPDLMSGTLVPRTHRPSRTFIHEARGRGRSGGTWQPVTKGSSKGNTKGSSKSHAQTLSEVWDNDYSEDWSVNPTASSSSSSFRGKGRGRGGKSRGKAQHHYDEWIATGLRGSVEEVRPLLQWYYPDQYTYHLDEFWYGTYDDQWYVNGRSWR